MYRTREGSFEFRVIVDGKHFESFVESPDANEIVTTAKQSGGFVYNEDRKAFETQSETTGAEPLQLLRAFERQGYAVILNGSLEHIDDIQNAA
ncbi:hypothetical protein AMC81_PA00090 (plasmid) [Rhizobium phaseoli]|uniref:DUF1508 domain-containing protein n=2 Tax=Rhizobium phaseoli TaxID=396 RepID=A0ABM6CFR9_9HYPH|nr:hypothetical protein AMC81_PA00090 [Rhizobium phaseoli]ANL93620.1 hypothetical protein AMC80_PA00090 [Rhizobium phaseoli]